MPTFSYVAMDSEGQKIKGEFDAGSLTLAINQVRGRGWFPISVEPEQRESLHDRLSRRSLFTTIFRRRISKNDIAGLTRELAELLQAGLPQPLSIGIVRDRQKPGKLRDILTEVNDEFRAGVAFPEALSRYPKVFDSLWVNMSRAGEATGALAASLMDLSNYQKKIRALEDIVSNGIRRLLLGFLLGFILLYYFSLATLPIIAKGLMDFGLYFPSPPESTLFSFREAVLRLTPEAIVWTIGAVIALNLAFRFEAVCRIRDWIILRIPVTRNISRNVALARFVRTMALLATHGIALVQSFEIARESSGNRTISASLAKARKRTPETEPLSEIMKNSRVFPPTIIGLIDAGEESGGIGPMLSKAADICEDNLAIAIARLDRTLTRLVLIAILVLFLYFLMFSSHINTWFHGDII